MTVFNSAAGRSAGLLGWTRFKAAAAPAADEPHADRCCETEGAARPAGAATPRGGAGLFTDREA